MNATRTIIIPVLDTTKEMRELLELAANDDDSDFTWALDLDISHIDSRAQGFDVRVVDVEIAGKRINAHLEMNYNVYNGCKDIDVDDIHDAARWAMRSGDEWIFSGSSHRPLDTVDSC